MANSRAHLHLDSWLELFLLLSFALLHGLFLFLRQTVCLLSLILGKVLGGHLRAGLQFCDRPGLASSSTFPVNRESY